MRGYLFITVMVLLTTIGQLLTKKGADSLVFEGSLLEKLKAYFNRYIVAAMVTILVVPVFYILALRDLDLSVAFAFTGLNYVLVSLGGKVFFKEKLNQYHLIGMICIVLGLAVFHF